MDELGALAPSLAELMDLNFFCGYSFAEIAALKGVSERTIQREWRKARTVVANVDAILAQRDTILDGVVLPDAVVDQLMDYMSALTDERARNLRYLTPPRVPSKLPVARP